MVAAHWARLPVSCEEAFESLRSKGIEPDDVTAEDLRGVDMLHMRGIAATGSLSKMAGISPGQNTLDEGSGVVSPARRIASKFGTLIWGVELSEPLYQTAVQFTILTGLQDQVSFKQGRALALAFKDGKFDVVAMAYIAIQIAEKDQLFGECRRVLKVDGRLAMHEIFGGPGGPPRSSLAWATDPDMS